MFCNRRSCQQRLIVSPLDILIARLTDSQKTNPHGVIALPMQSTSLPAAGSLPFYHIVLCALRVLTLAPDPFIVILDACLMTPALQPYCERDRNRGIHENCLQTRNTTHPQVWTRFHLSIALLEKENLVKHETLIGRKLLPPPSLNCVSLTHASRVREIESPWS